jgi:hypothetical protein
MFGNCKDRFAHWERPGEFAAHDPRLRCLSSDGDLSSHSVFSMVAKETEAIQSGDHQEVER